MSFCHQCGHALKSDVETTCPSCGIDLKHNSDQNNANETDYAVRPESNENTNLTPYSGTANFDDQLLNYTIIENTLIFDNTGDSSLKVLDLFQRLSHNSNLLYQLMSNNFQQNEEKAQELRDFSNTLAKSCQNMIDELEKIEVESKTRILEIKIGDLQISRHDLDLKNLVLMGNHYFYLNKYDYAIECYDKILELDVHDFEAGTQQSIYLE